MKHEVEKFDKVDGLKRILHDLKNRLLSGRARSNTAIDNDISPHKEDRVGIALDFPPQKRDGDFIECKLIQENVEGFLLNNRSRLRLGTEQGDVFVSNLDVYPSGMYCFECGTRKMYDQKEEEFFCPAHD